MDIGMLAICIFFGFVLGIISGIVPGIHTNTFAMILAALAPWLGGLGLTPICIAAIIVSNALTHTFIDIIPSVFLGAPEADTALAVLPGHQLLLDGSGIEAVRLSALGSACSVVFSLVLMVPLALLFTGAYPYLDRFMGWVLLTIVLILIYSERGELNGKKSRNWYRLLAATMFLISGILGLLSFGLQGLMSPLISFGTPSILMPLFSGLFGASMLVISMQQDTVIPLQAGSRISLPPKRIIRGVMVGSSAGSLVAWLPGITAAVATVLARLGIKEDYSDSDSAREFIVSISGVNTANAIFGLIALYAIGRTRSGAMVAVDDVMSGLSLDPDHLVLLLIVIVVVSSAAYFATIYLGERILDLLIRVNYRLLCATILLGLTGLVVLFTGWYGLMVFTASIPIGMLAPHLKVRRSHAMGVLLLPLILFYF